MLANKALYNNGNNNIRGRIKKCFFFQSFQEELTEKKSHLKRREEEGIEMESRGSNMKTKTLWEVNS